MSRQQQLDKIGELISDPGTCKIGLELVRRFELTPQEMCLVILESSLDPVRRLIFSGYVLNVDNRVFSHTEVLPNGTYGEYTLREIKLARWKPKWKIDPHDDGEYYAQKEILTSMGAI